MDKQEIPRTAEEMKIATQALFRRIEQSPTIHGYDEDAIGSVATMHLAWQAAQNDEDIEPDLKASLNSPQEFIKKFRPNNTGRSDQELLQGLGHRIGDYMETDANDYGVRYVTTRGKFKGKPPVGEDWVRTESDGWREVYVKRQVLDEAKTDQGIDLTVAGFHATTSAALGGINKRRALQASGVLRDEGEEVKSGEVYSRTRSHDHVFVSHGKFVSGYDTPKWFDQYGVGFVVDIEKQRAYLAAKGREFGLNDSDGHEIGDEVPLTNIAVVTAPSAHLDKIKKWVAENCPQAKVVSREVLQLKYGK